MGEKYRPNVGALIVNGAGKVLVGERIDNPGAWQFPQGGINKGENPREALQREIEEEIGLPPVAYTIVEERGGYRYDFPPGFRPWKNYLGQEQTYFLCEFVADDSTITIDTEHPEFSSWRWIEPADFDLAWVIEFKRAVYARVLKDFFSVAG